MTTTASQKKRGGDFKFRWTERLAASGLPRPVVEIGKALAHFADVDGTNARPGNKNLAEYANCSQRTVMRNLGVLREYGWAVVVRQGGRTKGGRSCATDYRLEIGRKFVDQGDILADGQVRTADQGDTTVMDQGDTAVTLQGDTADTPPTNYQPSTNQLGTDDREDLDFDSWDQAWLEIQGLA